MPPPWNKTYSESRCKGRPCHSKQRLCGAWQLQGMPIHEARTGVVIRQWHNSPLQQRALGTLNILARGALKTESDKDAKAPYATAGTPPRS